MGAQNTLCVNLIFVILLLWYKIFFCTLTLINVLTLRSGPKGGGGGGYLT